MNMDPGTWSSRVADAIRGEMATQRRSTGALAELLELSPDSAAARLDGATPFDLVQVEHVAAWLGLTPSELLARADELAA